MCGRRRSGFTLVELLVVIAVIAVLMGLLMPSLQRVRQQARTVVCLAHLKEWGTLISQYFAEHNGQLPTTGPVGHIVPPFPHAYIDWDYNSMLCPNAANPNTSKLGEFDEDSPNFFDGGTFKPWGGIMGERTTAEISNDPNRIIGSYGYNSHLYRDLGGREIFFNAMPHRHLSQIPLYFDCKRSIFFFDQLRPTTDGLGPPPGLGGNVSRTSHVVMNRHHGRINVLFLDYSVRKVELKSLWSLKWYPAYDTANRWTRAGGVQSEDWPPWMRKFKEE